jgi:HCOMODA/2-hydroxy-3-carboxy-muconic semialdehyde decarboxylase
MKSEERELLVRRAARALGRHGLVNAFGHCSARIDERTFLVCAPQPMGTIAPGKAGTVVNATTSKRRRSPISWAMRVR